MVRSAFRRCCRVSSFVLVASVLLAAPGLAPAYELSELDGDEVAGNAPVLLGWGDWDLPLRWAVIAGNVPVAGMDQESWIGVAGRAFMRWSSVPGSYLTCLQAEGDGAAAGVVTLDLPLGPSRFSPFRSLADGRTGPPRDDGYLNVVVCVDAGWTDDYGFSSGALAITQYGFDPTSRRLVGADVYLNCDSVRLPWAVLDPLNPDQEAFDVENTLVHEVGHFVGLAHPYAEGRETSTMWYMASPGETTKRTLSPDDADGLRYLYPVPGTPLVPPDTNAIGLKPLENSAGGGGCAVAAGGGAPAASLPALLLALLPLLVPRRRRP